MAVVTPGSKVLPMPQLEYLAYIYAMAFPLIFEWVAFFCEKLGSDQDEMVYFHVSFGTLVILKQTCLSNIGLMMVLQGIMGNMVRNLGWKHVPLHLQYIHTPKTPVTRNHVGTQTLLSHSAHCPVLEPGPKCVSWELDINEAGAQMLASSRGLCMSLQRHVRTWGRIHLNMLRDCDNWFTGTSVVVKS